MDQIDREYLRNLLMKLVSAQDNMTYYNDTGDTERCSIAQCNRDDALRRIMAFAELRIK